MIPDWTEPYWPRPSEKQHGTTISRRFIQNNMGEGDTTNPVLSCRKCREDMKIMKTTEIEVWRYVEYKCECISLTLKEVF